MTDPRLDDLELISAAAVAEVAVADPSAVLECAGWPMASELIAHLGNHFGWVLATIGADERPLSTQTVPAGASVPEWFASERDRFIETFLRMPESTPCWTLTGPGTLGFWYRRSTFEIVRHVWDLRTAGGVRPPAPPELSPERYADGVTEHFDVFLERSRLKLDPLPGMLKLAASDIEATWYLGSDWSRPDEADVESDPDAVIEGPAGELALLCWERADALTDSKLSVSGSLELVRAFDEARIHR
jgi:hypothetical protein